MLALSAAWVGFRVGKGIVDAGVQLQQMRAKMESATGSAAVAADALAFIREEANRLGLEVRSTTDGFANFAASALRAGLTLQQTKDVFRGVSEAATALQLSPERASLVFQALSQMAAKGTVSMEELRQQMGESLPVAISTFAKAMGVSQAEFIKLVENGKVGTAELVKFGNALHRDFGERAVQAAEGAQGAFNRLSNAFFDLQTKMANAGIIDVVTQAVRQLTDVLNDPKTADGLVKFAQGLAVIAQIALQVTSAIGSALYKIGELETKALSMVGIGPGVKNPTARNTIPIAPRPEVPGLEGYTLGKLSAPGETDAQKRARERAEEQRRNLRQQVAEMRAGLVSEDDPNKADHAKALAAMNKRQLEEQDLLDKALKKKAISEQEYREGSLALELDYQARMAEIRQQYREQYLSNQQAAAEGFLGIQFNTQRKSISDQAAGFRETISQAAQHNKVFFALEKAAALARATIAAYESVVNAYRFGSAIGGPVLGAAFAGVAAAAQAVNVAAIAGTSFNGGSGGIASSGGGGGDGGVSSQPSPTASSDNSGKITTIVLQGLDIALLPMNQVRELVDRINEAGADGARVQVRYA